MRIALFFKKILTNQFPSRHLLSKIRKRIDLEQIYLNGITLITNKRASRILLMQD